MAGRKTRTRLSGRVAACCFLDEQSGWDAGPISGKREDGGSMANFGEDDRFRSQMFEGTNKLRFERPVDDASRRWWLEKFYDTFGLTPEDMGGSH
jgi:hypothetical protein